MFQKGDDVVYIHEQRMSFTVSITTDCILQVGQVCKVRALLKDHLGELCRIRVRRWSHDKPGYMVGDVQPEVLMYKAQWDLLQALTEVHT